MASHNINNHHFKDYDALNWVQDWIRRELADAGPDELEDKVNADIEVWFKPERVRVALPRPKFEALVAEAQAILPADAAAWSAWAAEQGAVVEPMPRPDFDAWVDGLRAKEVIFRPADASKPGAAAGVTGTKAGPIGFTIQSAQVRDNPDNVFQVHNGKNKVWCLTELDDIDIEFTGHTPTTPEVTGSAVASMTATGIELSVKFHSKFEEAPALEKLFKDRVERMLRRLLEIAVGRWGYIVNENVNKGKRTADAAEPAADAEKAASVVRKTAATSTQGGGAKAVVSTTTLSDTVEVMASEEQLFQAFTDAQEFSRITNRPCKMDGPMPGATFELLDGAITGEFVEAERPRRVVQRWRHKDWPSGHFSRLQLDFKAGDNKTSLHMEWTGVPADRADAMMQNWKGFYVESIQRFFGRLLF